MGAGGLQHKPAQGHHVHLPGARPCQMSQQELGLPMTKDFGTIILIFLEKLDTLQYFLDFPDFADAHCIV